jgi:hypothetical protein
MPSLRDERNSKPFYNCYKKNKMMVLEPKFTEPYLFNELLGYEYVCPNIGTIVVKDAGNKYVFTGDMDGKPVGFIYTFFNQYQFHYMANLNKTDASQIIKNFQRKFSQDYFTVYPYIGNFLH